MKPRRDEPLPADKQKAFASARRRELLMIAWQSTVVVVMYFAMGSSQTMKTALIDDILALVPPIVFLISLRIRHRSPDTAFPYGYSRASLLAFLTAATAILGLGAYTFVDSGMALISGERPSLGHYNLFGWHVWIGWVMIGALVYSMLPSIVLAPGKLRLARVLHEKPLEADAAMNKAEWMTSGAGILGILGIGLGLWWADAAMALVIAFDILKDGVTNVKIAMSDLMDSRPTGVDDDEPLELEGKICERLLTYSEVNKVNVRLREAGNRVFGEIFVELDGQEELAARLEEMAREVAEIDWRLADLNIMPVKKVESSGG